MHSMKLQGFVEMLQRNKKRQEVQEEAWVRPGLQNSGPITQYNVYQFLLNILQEKNVLKRVLLRLPQQSSV